MSQNSLWTENSDKIFFTKEPIQIYSQHIYILYKFITYMHININAAYKSEFKSMLFPF